jgi:hypothetical protein
MLSRLKSRGRCEPAGLGKSRTRQRARRDAAAAFAAVLESPIPAGRLAAMRSMAPRVLTNLVISLTKQAA